MKYGISVSVDVTKIDKAKLAKGKYLNLTSFVDTDNQDKYGKNGFVTQELTKEERDSGVKGPILGNVKVFWSDGNTQTRQPNKNEFAKPDTSNLENDLPF